MTVLVALAIGARIIPTQPHALETAMRRYAVLIFAASLTLTGCAEDPSAAVPEAKVQAVEPAADKAPAQVPASHAVQAPPRGPQSIALEGQISFIGSKVTGSNTGRFTNWIGTAKLSETGELTSMSIVVQTKDVEANFEAPTKWSKKLEAHLRDDDFFASEKHPTATFQLDQVRAAPDKATGATHTLAGRFTIRVTKSIRFPRPSPRLGRSLRAPNSALIVKTLG